VGASLEGGGRSRTFYCDREGRRKAGKGMAMGNPAKVAFVRNEKMVYRLLGGSKALPAVSEVCLGTMTWGEQNTEEEAHAQLDLAVSRGVNFIDTAELYPVPSKRETQGRTERYIGSWLRARPGVKREDLVLATKVMGFTSLPRAYIAESRDPPGDPAEQLRPVRSQIRGALQASLNRLGTPYVDLYQIHWPDRYAPLWGSEEYRRSGERASADLAFEDQARAMAELIAEGKIRAWGVSNETPYGVTMFHAVCRQHGLPPPVSIQNDFSLLDRRFESGLAEACSPRHCSVDLLVYGGLAGGSLSGKYLGGEDGETWVDVPGARHTVFKNFQSRYASPPSRAATLKYVKLARESGMSPTALALGFCRSREYVGSTIVGATTLPQLNECIDAFTEEKPLSKPVLKAIDRIHRDAPNPNVQA